MTIYNTLLKEQKINREPPKNLNSKDTLLFSREFSRRMPSLVQYTYKNININSEEYLWKKLKFLKQTFFRRESRKKEIISNFKFLVKSLFKRKRIIDNGLWLIDNWSYGYFHWFADVLQKHTAQNAKKSKLILPYFYSKYEYIVSSSKILEIELLFIKEKEIIKCRNLTIIPTSFISGNFYPKLISDLSLKFKNFKTQKKQFNKVIYVSRNKSSRRKVHNEEELINSIKRHNGYIFYFEDHDWEDQINLVKNCDILICPHGASLTNILFAQNNIKIIELRHEESNTQNMYFSLASALNIDYYYLKCEGIIKDPHLSDIIVPVDKLNDLLKQME